MKKNMRKSIFYFSFKFFPRHIPEPFVFFPPGSRSVQPINFMCVFIRRAGAHITGFRRVARPSFFGTDFTGEHGEGTDSYRRSDATAVSLCRENPG